MKKVDVQQIIDKVTRWPNPPALLTELAQNKVNKETPVLDSFNGLITAKFSDGGSLKLKKFHCPREEKFSIYANDARQAKVIDLNFYWAVDKLYTQIEEHVKSRLHTAIFKHLVSTKRLGLPQFDKDAFRFCHSDEEFLLIETNAWATSPISRRAQEQKTFRVRKDYIRLVWFDQESKELAIVPSVLERGVYADFSADAKSCSVDLVSLVELRLKDGAVSEA